MQHNDSITEFLESQGYTSVELRTTPVGHLELDAIVEGNPARMLVDTGAGVTVIDRTMAERWAVSSESCGDTAVAGCVGDIGSVADATVSTLELAGVKLSNVNVKIMNLAQINSGLEGGGSHRIDGIIGSDLMISRGAVIEYGTRRLHLRNTES